MTAVTNYIMCDH